MRSAADAGRVLVNVGRWRRGESRWRGSYTCASFMETSALGVRGKRRSDEAIRAATMNATVVKKPKTFWARTRVECMVAVR